MTSRLSARQQRFINEYLVDLNASQAAVRAGYSPRTAYSQGQRLLKHVEVADAIARAMRDRAERARLKADDVIAEYRRIAFANILDFIRVQSDGNVIVDLSQLTRDQAAALTEISIDDCVEERGPDTRRAKRVRIKLADKRAALSDLGRHLGMFRDRVEHTGPDGSALRIQDLSDESLNELITVLSETAKMDASSKG